MMIRKQTINYKVDMVRVFCLAIERMIISEQTVICKAKMVCLFLFICNKKESKCDQFQTLVVVLLFNVLSIVFWSCVFVFVLVCMTLCPF